MTFDPAFSFSSPSRPRGILQLLKAYLSFTRLGDLLVLEGRLDSTQLSEALVIARVGNRRLGEVLLERRLIRRRDLWSTLGKQWGLRVLAWGVTTIVSFSSFMPRSVRAEDGRGSLASAELILASATPQNLRLEPLRAYPSLFGSAEKRSGDLSAFTKWSDMFARYERTLSSGEARTFTVAWKQVLSDLSGGSLADLARAVNSRINRVSYIEDRENWDRSDYWATPAEFLRRGGDCEDFAISKYMALKALGVPEERLRIAIVHDTVKNIPHAILVVYAEDGPLVLDNQTSSVRPASSVTRYKPIFSINRTAWWLHTRGASVQVATAAR